MCRKNGKEKFVYNLTRNVIYFCINLYNTRHININFSLFSFLMFLFFFYLENLYFVICLNVIRKLRVVGVGLGVIRVNRVIQRKHL